MIDKSKLPIYRVDGLQNELNNKLNTTGTNTITGSLILSSKDNTMDFYNPETPNTSGFIRKESTEDTFTIGIKDTELKTNISITPTSCLLKGATIPNDDNSNQLATTAWVKQILSQYKFITETWKDGTEWYRVWSDGWIEQGGQSPTPVQTETITFKKPFTEIPTVLCSAISYSTSGGNAAFTYVYDITTTTAGIGSGGWINSGILTSQNGVVAKKWYACGY